MSLSLPAGLVLYPLFWLAHAAKTSRVKSSIRSQTRESLYDAVDKVLLRHSPGTAFDLSNVFDKYAAEDAKNFPDMDSYWDEDCFTSYILDKFCNQEPNFSSATASLLRGAAPILWRMLCFFAWYPFGDEEHGCSTRHDLVDARSLKRAARILTDTRSEEALTTDEEGCMAYPSDCYEIIRTRRMFRSLCRRSPCNDPPVSVQSSAAATPQNNPASAWENLAGGTGLSDIKDTIRIAAFTDICHVPPADLLEEKALAIVSRPDSKASRFESSSDCCLSVCDFRILIKLISSIRLWPCTKIEFTDSSINKNDSADLLDSRILDSYITSVTSGVLHADELRKRKVIDQSSWESSHAITRHLTTSMRWLWQGIFHASSGRDRPAYPIPNNSNRALASSLVQWLLMCSPPVPSIDALLARSLDKNLSGYIDEFMYASIKRDRALELQQSSLMYEAGRAEVSSQDLMNHLCGPEHHRLLLIRGQTVDTRDGKDTSYNSELPAVVGLHLSSPVWNDLETGERQHYTVEDETCLFQILPELHVMRLNHSPRPPFMACLIDLASHTAGMRDEEDREHYREHSLNQARTRAGKMSPAQEAKLEYSHPVHPEDAIEIGRFGSLVPALSIDFESGTATLECSTEHPNLFLDDVRHIEAVPKPKPWRKAGDQERMEEQARAAAARRNFRTCLHIESVQVYRVPASVSGLQRLGEEEANAKLKSFCGKVDDAIVSTGNALTREEIRKRIQGFGPEVIMSTDATDLNQ